MSSTSPVRGREDEAVRTLHRPHAFAMIGLALAVAVKEAEPNVTRGPRRQAA